MEQEKRNKILKILGIIGIFVFAVGMSYALFTVVLNSTKKVKITTGTLSLRLLDENDNYVDELDSNASSGFDVELNDAVPLSYENALNQADNIYTFKVKNEGTIKAEYTLSLEDLPLADGESRLADKFVGFQILRDDTNYLWSYNLSEMENRVIQKGVIKPNEVHTYTLRLWLDDEKVTTENQSEAMNKVFLSCIKLNGSQTKKEKEVDVRLENLTVSTDGSPTYTTPEYAEVTYPKITYEDYADSYGSVGLNNVKVILNDVGDSVIYRFDVVNKGMYDVSLEIENYDLFPLFYCAARTGYRSDCLDWDYDKDGVLSADDYSFLEQRVSFQYLNGIIGSNPSIVLKAGEKKELTISAKYDKKKTDQDGVYKVYDGNYKLFYDFAL